MSLLGITPSLARGPAWISLRFAREQSPGFCNRTQRRHRPAAAIVTRLATRDALACVADDDDDASHCSCCPAPVGDDGRNCDECADELASAADRDKRDAVREGYGDWQRDAAKDGGS